MAGLINTKLAGRQNKLRALFRHNELDRVSSSAILKSNLLSNLDKELLNSVLSLGPKTKSAQLSKVRNICLISGRARATTQDYKISRNFFKSLSELGLISGVKKV